MEKARIGIVGLGGIAQTIHLPVLSRFSDVEIVAVCDADRAKAQYVADKFKVRRYYNSFEKMLIVEQDLDGIDICTPTKLHKEMAIAALEAKRNVLVEKPLSRTAKEAEEIVVAAKKTHMKLMVGMNNRFRPDSMILKSFVEDNALGKIFYAKAGWFRKLSEGSNWFTKKAESGGGVVLDLGIVMFDLAFWMMGYPEVKEVMATNYSHHTKGCRRFFDRFPQDEKRIDHEHRIELVVRVDIGLLLLRLLRNGRERIAQSVPNYQTYARQFGQCSPRIQRNTSDIVPKIIRERIETLDRFAPRPASGYFDR